MRPSACAPVAKVAQCHEILWVGRVASVTQGDDVVLLQRTAPHLRVLVLTHAAAAATRLSTRSIELAFCHARQSGRTRDVIGIRLQLLRFPSRFPLLMRAVPVRRSSLAVDASPAVHRRFETCCQL